MKSLFRTQGTLALAQAIQYINGGSIEVDLHLAEDGKIYRTEYQLIPRRNGVGSDKKLIKSDSCPLEDFRPEALKKWDVHVMADRIGDALYLLLPQDEITVAHILHCHNSTVQNNLITRYGEKEFFAKLNPQVIHQDGDNQLLEIRVDRNIIMLVKVKDSTTGQTYLLRVPPFIEIQPNKGGGHTSRLPMSTCKQAIAWTFGLKKNEYSPEKEA